MRSLGSVVLCVFLYLATAGIAFSDDILLKDGSLIRGKVIRVTAFEVEYDPEGEIPFYVIPRKEVEKIRYDNGMELKIRSGNAFPSVTKPSVSGGNTSIGENSERISNDDWNRIDHKSVEPERKPGRYAFELGWGWNSEVGFGALFDWRIAGGLTLNAGAGIGLWGGRLTAGLRYFLGYPTGSAFGVNVVHHTGVNDMETESEVILPNGSVGNATVTMDLKSTDSLNIVYIYSFEAFGRNKFFIQTGYAFGLNDAVYRVKSNHSLSQSERDAISEVMSPGGFILGLGVGFLY